MKTLLEPEDIQALANAIAEVLKPLIARNDKQNTGDTIFDVTALTAYLTVSKQWIYERTHLKEIPHLKIDGQLRFRKKDIDKWLNTYHVPAVTTSLKE